ncbi:MAG: hypothetical protein K6E28_10140 [Eubacterium sp.]|nr:hypothetical protein [Eubacterium sp.]
MREVEEINYTNQRLKKRKKGYASSIRAFEKVKRGQEFYVQKKAVLDSLRTLNNNIVDSDEILSEDRKKKMQEYYNDTIKKLDILNRAIYRKALYLGQGRPVDSEPTKMQKKLLSEAEQNDLLAKTLSKDLASFNKALKDNSEINMRGIFEESRVKNYAVKPGSVKVGTGGNLSQRIPLTIINEKGEEVEGFFTQDNQAKDIDTIKDAIKKTMAKYGKKASFLSLDNADDMYEQIAGFNDNFKKFISNYKYLSLQQPQKVFDILDPDNTYNLGGTIKNKQQLNIFLDIMHAAATVDNASGIMNDVGIKRTSRNNRRNSAMSLVADVLGCSELIAASENVKVNINGKPMKGTFMKKAIGSERDRMHKEPMFLEVTGESVENLKLKKQIADLQVLDYLCGNPDRHSGNFLLNFKKREDGTVVLESIQGIDNDLSFGSEDFERKVTLNAVKLSAMNVITRSMADKIMNLTPESLKEMLYGYELTTEEVKNAEVRLNALKEKIHNDNMEFGKGYGKGSVINGRIKVVEDDELKSMSFQDLRAKGKKENLFNRVSDLMNINVNLNRFEDRFKNDYNDLNYKATVEMYPEFSALCSKIENDTVAFQGKDNLYNLMLRSMKSLRDGSLGYSGAPTKANGIYGHHKNHEIIKAMTRQALLDVNNYIEYKDSKTTGEEWRDDPRKDDPKHVPGKTERRYKNAIEAREILKKQLEAFEEIDKALIKINEFNANKRNYLKNNVDNAHKSVKYVEELNKVRNENLFKNHESRAKYELYDLHFEAVGDRHDGNKEKEFLDNLKFDIALGYAVNSIRPGEREKFKKEIKGITSYAEKEMPGDDELLQRSVASLMVEKKLGLLKLKKDDIASNAELIALENLRDVKLEKPLRAVDDLVKSDEFKNFYNKYKGFIEERIEMKTRSISVPDTETVNYIVSHFGDEARKLHPDRKKPEEIIKPKEIPLRRVKNSKKIIMSNKK